MGGWVDFKKVDVRLAVTDSPVANLPVMMKCREHQDDKESLAVYPDGIWCFGCQFRVQKRMEALAYLLGCPLDDAFRVAGKYTRESIEAYRERAAIDARSDPLPPGLADAYANLLWGYRSERLDYLTGRGLSTLTIRQANLGHDGSRFTIPFYDRTKRLLTIRFRRDDAFGTEVFDPRTGEDRALPKYEGMRGRNGLFLYPEWCIERTQHDWVVVCEGEFDAMRLWQEDIPAVSPTNGAGNLKRVAELLPNRMRSLVIAADMDEPGQKAAWELEVAARQIGLKVSRLSWPEGWGKDVSELYLGGHTLAQANEVGDANWTKESD